MSDWNNDAADGRQPGRGLSALVALLVVILVILAGALGYVLLNRDGEPSAGPPLTASPVSTPTEPAATTATDAATPADTATPEPSPTTPEASPAPLPTETATERPTATPGREPTEGDIAAFRASYTPPGGQDVADATADVDGDGIPEIVFASRVADAARIDVAAWNGSDYEVVFVGQGGAAERIDDFQVRDFTGDDRLEIVTLQSVGTQGQSLSIWGWDDGRGYGPQPADGGCWDRSHTYGIIGAQISRGELTASCDGSPAPTAAWPSHVYEWDDGWVYARSVTP